MTASFHLGLGVCRRTLSGYSEPHMRLGGESLPCYEGVARKKWIDRVTSLAFMSSYLLRTRSEEG